MIKLRFFKATTRRSEEQIRKRFKVQLPESLHQSWYFLFVFNKFILSFWFRKDAITEADEILVLPTNLRVTAFERMLQQLLTEANYPVPQQGIKIVKSVILKKKMKLISIFRKRKDGDVR